jgi:hypothetical protein
MKHEIDTHLLARVNRAVLNYYAQADQFKAEINFCLWLPTLRESLREHFRQKGFEESKDSIPFMRHVLELNDIGMDEHMKANLSKEDYATWISPDNTLMAPKEMNILNPDDKSNLS